MLSSEVIATLRKILATQAGADEESARLIHQCWVELREQEAPPETLETIDLESLTGKGDHDAGS